VSEYKIGDRVRVKAAGSSYYGHTGVIIDRADSGEWAVQVAGMSGKWRLYYRSDELEAA
jgi:hypothetical protein